MDSPEEFSRVNDLSEVEPFLVEPQEISGAGARSPRQFPTVRLIYLVPKDRMFSQQYADAIANAAADLIPWFKAQVGNGRTFRVGAIETYTTEHDRSWYAEETNGRTFWKNVLQDGFKLTGGKFFDPDNRWIFYIDATNKPNSSGGGGTSGVAVLPEKDLEGLVGMHGPISRWIGGLGHELGHALELPHPPECSGGSSLPDPPCNSLMYLGYLVYPQTYLAAEDKTRCANSPFFNDPT